MFNHLPFSYNKKTIKIIHRNYAHLTVLRTAIAMVALAPLNTLAYFCTFIGRDNFSDSHKNAPRWNNVEVRIAKAMTRYKDHKPKFKKQSSQ